MIVAAFVSRATLCSLNKRVVVILPVDDGVEPLVLTRDGLETGVETGVVETGVVETGVVETGVVVVTARDAVVETVFFLTKLRCSGLTNRP